jgi:hypothetical protein
MASEYTGRHLDGLANKVTCWAVANPSKEPHPDDKLTTRAAGFGVVRFNKRTRQITFECWPRNVDVTDPEAKQYPGWPRTIEQQDNYGRKAAAYLPTLEIKNRLSPVVQVIDESNNEIVYTLRINGRTFRPKVFDKGTYTINIGQPPSQKSLTGIKAIDPNEREILIVTF